MPQANDDIASHLHNSIKRYLAVRREDLETRRKLLDVQKKHQEDCAILFQQLSSLEYTAGPIAQQLRRSGDECSWLAEIIAALKPIFPAKLDSLEDFLDRLASAAKSSQETLDELACCEKGLEQALGELTRSEKKALKGFLRERERLKEAAAQLSLGQGLSHHQRKLRQAFAIAKQRQTVQ